MHDREPCRNPAPRPYTRVSHVQDAGGADDQRQSHGEHAIESGEPDHVEDLLEHASTGARALLELAEGLVLVGTHDLDDDAGHVHDPVWIVRQWARGAFVVTG